MVKDLSKKMEAAEIKRSTDMSRLDELKQGIVDIVKKNIVYRWSTCSRATCPVRYEDKMLNHAVSNHKET